MFPLFTPALPCQLPGGSLQLLPHFNIYLQLQQQLAGRPPALEILMRCDGLAERIDLVDLDIELPGLDQIQHTIGVELQLLARDNILHERRAHDGDVLRREFGDVERRDGTRCC